MADRDDDQQDMVPDINSLIPAIPEDGTQAQRKRSAPDPHTGLTEKQECFAQAVARQGMNYSDAYRLAYDCSGMKDSSIWTNSSMLAANTKVALRIDDIVTEIKMEHSAGRATRAERIVQHLEKMMISAKTDAGRLKAAELLGKTVGLYRDVQENVGGDGQSVSELEAQLAKLLKRQAE